MLLKALSTRQKMTNSAARLSPLYSLIVERQSVSAFRVINTVIDQLKTQDRVEFREELFALHNAGSKEFIAMLNGWPEMGQELDIFLDALKEAKRLFSWAKGCLER